MRSLVSAVLAGLFLCGCAVGFQTQKTYDASTGKWTAVKYSPAFISEILKLEGGLEAKISVVNMRRVNPLKYAAMSAADARGPEDLDSEATAVIHYRNDTSSLQRFQPLSLRVNGKEFGINMGDVPFQPKERLETYPIYLVIKTYDTEFDLTLLYVSNGVKGEHTFHMRRETAQEAQEAMRKWRRSSEGARK
jgi:hypothetical protein